MIFFQRAPQLGGLQAGLATDWPGAPLAVVVGGLGCLVATGRIAARTPALLRYQSAAAARL
jgi:hypothetical protein